MACSRFLKLQSHNFYGSVAFRRRPATARDAVSAALMLRLSPFLAIPSSPRYLPFCSNCYVPSAQLAVDHHQQQQPHLRSPNLVALEYADLNLSYNLDLGHVRIRQHVNPLSSSFSVPAQVPDWNQVFADPTLPLMVDIGCGSGRFLMWLAKRTPKVRNYMGLEIRQKLVKRAELWVKDLALDNIHFLFANATISFKQLVESYPGPLLLVSVLVPAQVPDWNQVFADPTLPLMVDIGCGSGRFLMWLAKRTPKVRNYMGLEIRQKLVKRAELWVKDLALDNIHFLFANATISFKQLVESYPGPLLLVSVLCPDPHFKKRHHKRRVLQKPLIGAIVDNLMPGGQVFVQSDVLEMALDMRNQFDEVDALRHIDALNPVMLCDSEGWLLSNPMGIRTEREIHAEFEGAKIYRRLYQKQL